MASVVNSGQRAPAAPSTPHQAPLALLPSPLVAPGTSDWRAELPTLVGTALTLRELRLSDAPCLLATMTAEAVARFITTPPGTIRGFERFVAWSGQERRQGSALCFAVVPDGGDEAIGLFQVRRVDGSFETAEWGFAIASAHWGTGCFVEAARMVVDFAVDTLGVHRLEARSAVANGRGNGALRKVGAVHEGVLRRAFHKDGRVMDQALWSILADDWRQARARRIPFILH